MGRARPDPVDFSQRGAAMRALLAGALPRRPACEPPGTGPKAAQAQSAAPAASSAGLTLSSAPPPSQGITAPEM